MAAATNFEQQIVADSPYAEMSTARLYRGNPYQGLPRYDSRFARRYARHIMAAAGYYAELDEEFRRSARNDNGNWRADAGLSMAFARSLEYIIRKPFEAEYPELRAADFIPLMTEVPPEANSFTYRMLDKIGEAKIINENGSDAPKVDLKGEEWQQPIVTVGASYDYTILDTMRASRMGIPLESYKAEAARFAIEYYIEQLAAVGNVSAGLVGLSNAPGIQAVSQVSTGGNWIAQVAGIAGATPSNPNTAISVVSNIASDVNALISAIFAATNGTYRPDTLLIPVAAYGALMTAPQSPGFMNKTILQFLEETTQLDIECWPQLNQAGATTTTFNSVSYKGRVLAYKRDPKLLNLVIPQPFTQLPPQAVKMAWEVTAYARTGAVQVRQPKTVAYMDGVS